MRKMLVKGNTKLKWSLMSVATVAMCCSTGCQSAASISWNKPTQSKALNKTVCIKKAEWGDGVSGDSAVVGKHTFTVFAIPVSRIAANRPIDECVTEAAADVYTRAGYTVVDSAESSADVAIVAPTLTKFNYWSYSWLWPLFITGGGIQMDVAVESKSGQTLWRNSYQASSHRVTFGTCDGFDSAIRGDLTQIVNKMSADAKGNSAKINEQQTSTASAVPLLQSKVTNSDTGKVQPATASLKSVDVSDQMKKLKELKDAGLLTEEEFEAKRKELVGQL